MADGGSEVTGGRMFRNQGGGKRLVSNMVALNFRVVISAGLSLATTRFVLVAIGVVDFGIFSLIAGLAGLVAFLSAAMSSGTQRYISFALGRGRIEEVRRNLLNAILLHILVALAVFLLGGGVALALIRTVLDIPEGRERSAEVLLQLTLISTCVTVLGVPFQALFAAHERLGFVSMLQILQSVLNFALAWSLRWWTGDVLMVYGAGMTINVVVMVATSSVVAWRSFPDCFRGLGSIGFDSKGILEQVRYSGWNIFGAAGTVGRLQGVSVLLNIFFGTTVNAAYGVASQVAGQVAFLSQTLMRAANPQIVKAEGAGNRARMIWLTLKTSKYAIFLLSLVSMPLVIATPQVLDLWLEVVPDGASLFLRLILVGALVDQFTAGFIAANQAVGKVAGYQASVGSTLLGNLLVGYFLFRMSYPPESILVSAIVIQALAGGWRIYFVRRASGLRFGQWLESVLIPTLKWMPVPVLVGAAASGISSTPGIAVAFVTVAFLGSAFLSFWILGFDGEERGMVIRNLPASVRGRVVCLYEHLRRRRRLVP